MNELTKQIIEEKLHSYFLNASHVEVAYLFGSVARGTARSQSDVDVAVLFSSDLTIMERFEHKLTVSADLEDLLRCAVDVVDLKSADLFFIHCIMMEKVLLFERNASTRVAFEVKARREFFDREHYYHQYQECSMQRLEKMANDRQSVDPEAHAGA